MVTTGASLSPHHIAVADAGVAADRDSLAVAWPRVLVVDDDPALREMLGWVLDRHGFDPVACGDGDQVLDLVRELQPAVVLLDWMLPGGTCGLVLCRQIRAESTVPIVMLTARIDTTDVVAALDAGADDYITKPFKSAELVARLRTRLRQPVRPGRGLLRVGDLLIDGIGHTVHRGDHPLPLTPLEFDLLHALASRPGHVFSRDELLQHVWGYQPGTDPRLVNVHVQRLRGKIEPDPAHPQIVLTVRGIGYATSEPAPSSTSRSPRHSP